MKEQDNEAALRDRAIELTIKYFEGKDLVPIKAFMEHIDRVYQFLSNGKTENRV